MLSVSVIILTYNSASHIEKLIQSLVFRYSKVLNKELEIIVADNSSSDETLKIARKFDGVKVFENGGNLGFAKGINLAVTRAKGDILIFINPDAVFVDGDIFELAKKINEKVAVVGGKIIKTDGSREPSAGKFYNLLNIIFWALGIEEKMGIRFSPMSDKFVDFVSGGFFAVKRSVFNQMGGFDENLFMYVEDMEFCYSVKKGKKEVLFSNVASIRHEGQGSSSKTFAVVNIYKGILYFYKKHMGIIPFVLAAVILKLKAMILVIIGRISNNKYLYTTYREAIKA